MSINKIKLNNNLLILIVLIVFLGSLYYNSKYIILEGNATIEESKRNAKEIENTLKRKGKIDINIFSKLLDDLITTFKGESKSILDKDSEETSDIFNKSELINTTPKSYPGKTFFHNDEIHNGFCEKYESTNDINAKCNQLTSTNCNLTNCCTLINGKKCVSGDINGPKLNDMDYNFYLHKNICYGNCKGTQTRVNDSCSLFENYDSNISNECINKLWKNTGCINKSYVTNELIDSYKDHTKQEIQSKMNEIKLSNENYGNELHYDKCYGSDDSKWPEPCINKNSMSTNLSKRCIKKLFKNSGCSNIEFIDDAFVERNNIKTKSYLMNFFDRIYKRKDKEYASRIMCNGKN